MRTDICSLKRHTSLGARTVVHLCIWGYGRGAPPLLTIRTSFAMCVVIMNLDPSSSFGAALVQPLANRAKLLLMSSE
ncbi:hypothetical protein RchiOBHm_Chr6g0312771 [Rosa chinensis]|uniref:Uncharacterized protein n=1 Tax=Rosa chinensis TaxID=74649 RepID=A0A2P6Q1R4_ROSCH|nr:hypothetical protein RchiOBHm_Chr6g0312771 [Rosa chinensis]